MSIDNNKISKSDTSDERIGTQDDQSDAVPVILNPGVMRANSSTPVQMSLFGDLGIPLLSGSQVLTVPTNHGGKSVRSKYPYAEYQVAVLEKHFETSHYLTKESREMLSQLSLLPEEKIKVWFQNRRMREKRLQKKIQSQGSRPDLLPMDSPSKSQSLYGSPGVDMSSINECIQRIQARKISEAMANTGRRLDADNATKPVTIVPPDVTCKPPVAAASFIPPFSAVPSSQQGLLMIKPPFDRYQIPGTKDLSSTFTRFSAPSSTIDIRHVSPLNLPVSDAKLMVSPQEDKTSECLKPGNQEHSVPPKKRRRQNTDHNFSLSTQLQPANSVPSSSPSVQLSSHIPQSQNMWTNPWSPGSHTVPWIQQLSYPYIQPLTATPPPTPSPPIQCFTPRPHIGHGLPQCQKQQVISPSVFNQIPTQSGMYQATGNPYDQLQSCYPFSNSSLYQSQHVIEANRWYAPSRSGYNSNTPVMPHRPVAPDTPVSPNYQKNNATYEYPSSQTASVEERNLPNVFSSATSTNVRGDSQQAVVSNQHFLLDADKPTLSSVSQSNLMGYWTSSSQGSHSVPFQAVEQEPRDNGLAPHTPCDGEEETRNIDSPRTFYNLDLQPPKATSSPVQVEFSESTPMSTSQTAVAAAAQKSSDNPMGNTWLQNILCEPISDVEEDESESDS